MKTKSPSKAARPATKPKRKTKAQKRAALFLDLHAMIHFLMTEQRCPVLFDGRLAYVRCPGVCKEAFKLAIDKRVSRNLLAWVEDHVPPASPTRPTEPEDKK